MWSLILNTRPHVCSVKLDQILSCGSKDLCWRDQCHWVAMQPWVMCDLKVVLDSWSKWFVSLYIQILRKKGVISHDSGPVFFTMVLQKSEDLKITNVNVKYSLTLGTNYNYLNWLEYYCFGWLVLILYTLTQKGILLTTSYEAWDNPAINRGEQSAIE